MKRDYEINENNEINEKPKFFRLFSYFRLFRNPSSLILIIPLLLAATVFGQTSPASRFEDARRLQEEGRYAEAEAAYRAVLETEPRSIAALTNLGVTLARQKRFTEAI